MKKYNPTAAEENGSVIITGVDNFDPAETFECGQAFRWSELSPGVWQGFALGRYIKIGCENGSIVIFDTTLDEYEKKWRRYLDIDRDYGKIIEEISENPVLKAASVMGSGIRILRQDPWETLCSFIISQNNNIPRIKGIVERLCENFGDECNGGHSFPTAERIASLCPDDLAPLRCGFRARYIIDGARKFSEGQLDFLLLEHGDIDEARKELEKILGVGAKVADCTLLFGFARVEALPKDVWIKRALAEYFGGELPEAARPYAGIAQQYIFNYARNNAKSV